MRNLHLQTEQWLMLSNVVNYIQYNRNPKHIYELDSKPIDQKNHCCVTQISYIRE